MKMKECVAIVTGGASGLGEATVRNIVAQAGKAVIFDLQEEKGVQLVNELGEQARFIQIDITNESEVQAALEEVMNSYGKINTLINCAGIGIARRTLSKKGAHDLESFTKVIQVNLIGTFNMIRLVAEKMTENEPNEHNERGVIINTASVAAFEGQIGQVAYSASKGGVVGMTLPVARDLANTGIRVMTIAPGLFETPLFGQLPEQAKEALGEMTLFPSRLGHPSEYAQLVQSVIENPMLNGETIRIDGAIRMQPK